MLRVNGKIERLLLFDPLDTKRQGVPLSLLPSRSFHDWGRLGIGGLGRTIRVGEHINAWYVNA
jgi:hypothetical protein